MKKFSFNEKYGANPIKVTIISDSGWREVHLVYTSKRGHAYWLDREDYIEDGTEKSDLFFTRIHKNDFETVENVESIRHWRIPMKAIQVFARMCEIYLD